MAEEDVEAGLWRLVVTGKRPRTVAVPKAGIVHVSQVALRFDSLEKEVVAQVEMETEDGRCALCTLSNTGMFPPHAAVDLFFLPWNAARCHVRVLRGPAAAEVALIGYVTPLEGSEWDMDASMGDEDEEDEAEEKGARAAARSIMDQLRESQLGAFDGDDDDDDDWQPQDDDDDDGDNPIMKRAVELFAAASSSSDSDDDDEDEDDDEGGRKGAGKQRAPPPRRQAAGYSSSSSSDEEEGKGARDDKAYMADVSSGSSSSKDDDKEEEKEKKRKRDSTDAVDGAADVSEKKKQKVPPAVSKLHCPECQKKCKSEEGVLAHMEAKHPK